MPQDLSFSRPGQKVVAPAKTGLLEITKCSAKWHEEAHSTVDLTAEGFIRHPYRAVRLEVRGIQNIQADGEASARPALVIFVEEISSTFPGNVPRGYFVLDNIVAPRELSDPRNTLPEVVFCGLQPGANLNTPAVGKLKRTRIGL